MAARVYDTPVLIVGAGPVGSVLALELARHNVPSMVVERSLAPSPHPKMDYINGRSMELLHRLGLARAIRERGIGPKHATDFLWTRGFDEPPVLVWHHPSVQEEQDRFAGVNDGSAPAEAYQRVQGSLLEELVRDAAREHPLVTLCEGSTFTDLRLEQSGGVTATIADATAHRRDTVEARFLVACDGASSTVRRCLGITLDETQARTQHCSVYFTSRDPALRRYGSAFVTVAARGLTLVSRDERETWTASMPVPADEPFAVDPMDVVQERLGVCFEVDRVLSVAQWEGTLAVAASYGKGSAFLAGDSAHQFFPMGGHGANTGIADAVDLGWKIAAVVTGWGGPRLLASYELERRPVALFNRELCGGLRDVWLRFSRLAAAGASREHLAGILERDAHQVDNLGVHFGYRYTASPIIWPDPCPPPPWRADRITPTTWPGSRAPAVRLTGGGQLFDRLGPGFTLVDLSGKGTGAPLATAAGERAVPVTHLELDDAAVRACWERDLVLVRPDQHVAWRGDAAPEDWTAVLDRVTGQECRSTHP
ncbi:MAG TPA: FAD-dependent monooxygenase [Rugosimonospora sp.]|nr:FAD-dependent monooxygenase [Rugosimonospora sp.]